MGINEQLSTRSKALLFSTLEMLRKEIQPRFSDWKDADDWLFSQLDFSKDELAQIYDGRNVLYYDGSAVDFDAAKLQGDRQKCIELLIGHPIFSDEAKAVIEELDVMLGIDAVDINKDFSTDAERQDMIRYVERIINEYKLEEAEREIKDGFHSFLNSSIPVSDICFCGSNRPLSEQIAEAEEKLASSVCVPDVKTEIKGKPDRDVR